MPFKTYLIGGVALVMLTVIVGQKLTIDLKSTEIKKMAGEITQLTNDKAGLEGQVKAYDAVKLNGEEIAQIAAKSCQSTIKFRAQAQTEAKVIHDAPTVDAAARAYDELLCARPEAAGHPACAGRPAPG